MKRVQRYMSDMGIRSIVVKYKIDNNFYLAIDHYDEEEQAYVVHHYQIIMDDEEWWHTATSGWYLVSVKDGTIKDGMPF